MGSTFFQVLRGSYFTIYPNHDFQQLSNTPRCSYWTIHKPPCTAWFPGVRGLLAHNASEQKLNLRPSLWPFLILIFFCSQATSYQVKSVDQKPAEFHGRWDPLGSGISSIFSESSSLQRFLIKIRPIERYEIWNADLALPILYADNADSWDKTASEAKAGNVICCISPFPSVANLGPFSSILYKPPFPFLISGMFLLPIQT